MNPKSLDDVYRLYMDDVYRYIRSLCRDHHLAEDIVQEVFLRAYLYVEHYRGETIQSWLYKVAYHTFVDHVRKHKRQTVQTAAYFDQLKHSGTKTPEAALDANVQRQHIHQWLDELPEKQRHAILLADFHGLSYREGAEVMDVRESHFKILLYRARQKMRQLREREEKQYE